MSEDYYMHDYIEPDQDRIDEIGELEDKIEDLELEISRLEDELSYAIPIDWLEEWSNKNTTYANTHSVIKRAIREWKRKKEGK